MQIFVKVQATISYIFTMIHRQMRRKFQCTVTLIGKLPILSVVKYTLTEDCR